MKNEPYFKEFVKIIQEIFRQFKVKPNFIIKNNDKNETPFYIPNEKTISLATSEENLYYQQIIFQMSHEMIHQLVYEIANVNKYDGNERKESEVICVAFSLYIVKKLGWENYFNNAYGLENSIYSKYKKEIHQTYKNLKRNFNKTFKEHVDKAVNEFI